ncbi:MAG: hypothetical protein AB7V18_11870 [Pyrinomonadaceae bacterium]
MKRPIIIVPFLILVLAYAASAQSEGALGKVYWRGSVDNKVHLIIRGNTLEQRTVEGQDTGPGTFSFTSSLPEQAVTVGVIRKEGKSKKIAVVQQPTAENLFTAIVEVHDDGGGAREYILEIFWR